MYRLTRDRENSGQALVEFAIAFPIQLIIVFTVIQLCYVYVGHILVQYAAFSAARTYIAAKNAEHLNESPWDAAVEPETVARKAAAIICTPITGPTEGPSPQTPIRFPGWNHASLERSGIALDPNITFVEFDTSREGEVSATVRYRMELVFPIARYLLNDMIKGGEVQEPVTIEQAYPLTGTDPADRPDPGFFLDDNDFGDVPRREIVESCTIPYPEGALLEDPGS